MDKDNDGRSIAVIAESLYVVNLFIPILMYIGLLVLNLFYRKSASQMVRVHLRQAVLMATISTAVFSALGLLILMFFNANSIAIVIILEAYFIIIVPLFIIPGLFGLVKAISGETYSYPILGKMIKIQNLK